MRDEYGNMSFEEQISFSVQNDELSKKYLNAQNKTQRDKMYRLLLDTLARNGGPVDAADDSTTSSGDEDDVDINIKNEDDNCNKCWYELGNELGNTFISHAVRKQAYINFVTNILCAAETGYCDYSIFKFSKNMKKNRLSSVMALDIIPLVARMLHSEAMHYEEKNINSQYGDMQRTRRSRTNSKYNYISNATQLPESTLSLLLEFGFISSLREIGYTEKPNWM